MALESTQPRTEMSTRNLPGGKGQPARKADNLTAISEPTLYKMEPRRLTTLWASTACYKDSFTTEWRHYRFACFILLRIKILGYSSSSGLSVALPVLARYRPLVDKHLSKETALNYHYHYY
jgi:hypothetical protein